MRKIIPFAISPDVQSCVATCWGSPVWSWRPPSPNSRSVAACCRSMARSSTSTHRTPHSSAAWWTAAVPRCRPACCHSYRCWSRTLRGRPIRWPCLRPGERSRGGTCGGGGICRRAGPPSLGISARTCSGCSPSLVSTLTKTRPL